MASDSREPEPEGSTSSRSGAVATASQERIMTPDQEAREDLVRWCSEHGLPVPPPDPTRRIQ